MASTSLPHSSIASTASRPRRARATTTPTWPASITDDLASPLSRSRRAQVRSRPRCGSRPLTALRTGGTPARDRVSARSYSGYCPERRHASPPGDETGDDQPRDRVPEVERPADAEAGADHEGGIVAVDICQSRLPEP